MSINNTPSMGFNMDSYLANNVKKKPKNNFNTQNYVDELPEPLEMKEAKAWDKLKKYEADGYDMSSHYDKFKTIGAKESPLQRGWNDIRKFTNEGANTLGMITRQDTTEYENNLKEIQLRENNWKQREADTKPEYETPEDVWNVAGGVGGVLPYVAGGVYMGASKAPALAGQVVGNIQKGATADLILGAAQHGAKEDWDKQLAMEVGLGAVGSAVGTGIAHAFSKGTPNIPNPNNPTPKVEAPINTNAAPNFAADDAIVNNMRGLTPDEVAAKLNANDFGSVEQPINQAADGYDPFRGNFPLQGQNQAVEVPTNPINVEDPFAWKPQPRTEFKLPETLPKNKEAFQDMMKYAVKNDAIDEFISKLPDNANIEKARETMLNLKNPKPKEIIPDTKPKTESKDIVVTAPDGNEFNATYIKENGDRIVYEVDNPYRNQTHNIILNKNTGEFESAIDPGDFAKKGYQKESFKIKREEEIIPDNAPIEEAPIPKGFQAKTMMIGDETINKTDFDNIQKYQKTRKWNRNNPDRKREIPQAQKDAYDKHTNIADDLQDMDFETADRAGIIPFANGNDGIAGGAFGGLESEFSERDYNNDGKHDAMDNLLGAVVGAVGIKAARKLMPKYFKDANIDKNTTGMFVGARPDENGAFSDIATKKVMREIDDRGANFDKKNIDILLSNLNSKVEGKIEKNYYDFEQGLKTADEYQDVENKLLNQLVTSKTGTFKLDRVFKHDELFNKYPELKDVQVEFSESVKKGNAQYNSNQNKISINRYEPDANIKSKLLHEIQHAIQSKEGWARGGSVDDFKLKGSDKLNESFITKAEAQRKPKVESLIKDLAEKRITKEEFKKIYDSMPETRTIKEWSENIANSKNPFEAYQRLWGEQQARATQARMNYTPEQRASEDWTKTLKKTEGKYNEPIIKYDDGIANSEAKPKGLLEKKKLQKQVDIATGKIPELGREVVHPNKTYYLGDSGKVYFKRANGTWRETPNANVIEEVNYVAKNGKKALLDRMKAEDEAFNAKQTEKEVAEVKKDDNFKSWFKGSKIIDERGEPLVVYHGTGSDISEFKPAFIGSGNDQYGSGYYFTDKADIANYYTGKIGEVATDTRGNQVGGTNNPNIMPVFLDIKKPIVIDETNIDFEQATNITLEQIKKIIEKSHKPKYALSDFGDISYDGYNKVLDDAARSYIDTGDLEVMNRLSLQFFNGEEKAFNKIFQEVTGYDGVKIKLEGGTNFVALNPTQIKSVNNKGTFSKTDPNILNSSPTVSGGIVGGLVGGANDPDQDGKVTWKDFAIGAAVGAGGTKLAMKASDSVSLAGAKTKLKKAINTDFVDAFTGHKIYAKKDYMKVREEMIAGKNAKMEDFAQLHEQLALLSDAAKTNIHKYMSGEKAELSPALKSFADDYTKQIEKMGQELVDLGVLDAAQYNKFKGRYLHRVYEKDLTKSIKTAFSKGKTIQGVHTRGNEWTGTKAEFDRLTKEGQIGDFFDGKIEARKLNNGQYKFTQDWTKQQREKWGEVKDIAYTLPETLMRMNDMLQHGKMLDKVSKQTDIVSDEAIDGFTHLQGKRFGALQGKYVPKDVASDITEFNKTMFGSEDGTIFSAEVVDAYKAASTFWKKSHTVYNPTAHMNNLLSNVTMQYMEGINPATALKNSKRGYEAHAKLGEFRKLTAKKLIGLSKAEETKLAALTDDTDLTLYIQANDAGLFGRSKLNDILGQYVKPDQKKAKGVLGKLDDVTSNMYQGEDNIMRFSLLKSLVDQGKNFDDAIKQVNNTIPDYTKPMSRMARFGRASMLTPFISWTYYSTPIVLRQMKERPGRAAALAGSLYAINQAMGIDPYDKKDIPQQNFSMKRIPVYKNGNEVSTIKVDRWMPHNEILSPHDFIKNLYNGGAWKGGYEVLNNQNLYYGGKISYNEGARKAYDITKHGVQQITPDALDKVWNLAESQILSKKQRTKNPVIQPRSTVQETLGFLGLNTLTYNKANQRRKVNNEKLKK